MTTWFTHNGTKHELLQANMMFAEARAVEKVTGHTFQEISDNKALRGKADVLQALLWVSVKRTDPTRKFSDLDTWRLDELEWIDDEATEDGEPAPDPSEAETSAPSDSAT